MEKVTFQLGQITFTSRSLGLLKVRTTSLAIVCALLNTSAVPDILDTVTVPLIPVPVIVAPADIFTLVVAASNVTAVELSTAPLTTAVAVLVELVSG